MLHKGKKGAFQETATQTSLEVRSHNLCRVFKKYKLQGFNSGKSGDVDLWPPASNGLSLGGGEAGKIKCL